MKKIACWTLALFMIIGIRLAAADPIIPPEEFPQYNSMWNLNNTGIYFSDGEYFFVNGGGGKLFRLDDQLQLDRDIFGDEASGISRMSYQEDEHMLYFLADKLKNKKEGGLCRVKFRDGLAEGKIECLVKGVVANYAINNQYICYNVAGIDGIYRIDHDGQNKQKISKHGIQSKNPAVRMHISDDGMLYYINQSDHYLWTVPVEAQDSSQARVFIDRPMHYYVTAKYRRQGSDDTELIYIYVEYAPNTDALDKSHLAVVDERGERVTELDFIRDIQSRYINYSSGVLYYIDSSCTPQMPCWVRLDGGESGEIYVEGQNDLKAFHASDGTHWEYNNRAGYIHVFGNWVVIAELGDTYWFINPSTGRTDKYGGAGTDIWFIDTNTMTSYRCRKIE